MNDKQKKLINFLIVDTGYWIITIVVAFSILAVGISFLSWDLYAVRSLWGLKWLLFRVTLLVSLIFALIGGWSSGHFN